MTDLAITTSAGVVQNSVGRRGLLALMAVAPMAACTAQPQPARYTMAEAKAELLALARAKAGHIADPLQRGTAIMSALVEEVMA